MTSNIPLFLRYVLAALPILVLLGLMIGPRWSAQKAGPTAWLCGIAIAALAFGLTFDVWWVSQARGLLLSLYVLAVLWPALLLYNVVDRTGGIRAIAEGLNQTITDRGLLLLMMAWAFSGMLEGLAGFGLPIAIVSPMLVALGLEPVAAVAAVAVGHAWSVTFGDMGVIFQTLTGVVQMEPAELAPTSALMLGAACLLCGLAAARILNQGRLWLKVLGLGVLMAAVQYGLAVGGLAPLAALGAGLAGILGGILIGRQPRRISEAEPSELNAQPASSQAASTRAASIHAAGIRAAGIRATGIRATGIRATGIRATFSPSLASALAAYGSLGLLMTVVTWPGPLRALLYPTLWQMRFPQVATLAGFITKEGTGQAFRPLVHPGTWIFLVSLFSYAVYRWQRLCLPGDLNRAAKATWKSAAPASAGIIATVGLSTLMDHTGMTQLLAQGMAALMGAAFPLVSPLVGILGAFATGSNNNSNVLFAPLQKSIAALLNIDPRLLLAAQTAGGALGSMIAPAKIVVGCSTVGLKGREGDVLRRTLFYGLGIGLLLGGLALIFAR